MQYMPTPRSPSPEAAPPAPDAPMPKRRDLWSELGLGDALVRAAVEAGYSQPTPIQHEAIPAILRGADVLGLAQTGSGKTAAFVLPLLQRLALARLGGEQGEGGRRQGERAMALVLVPTRELAAQVGDAVRQLGQHVAPRVKAVVAFGGVSINPQMMALRGGADVLVATPGRLLDLVAHNAVRLSSVTVLVLDEADRMLDLGFADEFSRILALLPARRQTLLFSATFPASVEGLAASLLRTPVRIEVAAGPATDPAIEQRAIAVDAARRTQLLLHLIREHRWSPVLVFVATRYAAEHVAEKLYRAKVYATPFHGELSQGARRQVLEELKANRWDVVVTTDLAARGLDIEQLPAVVNYDLPRSADDYVHRIGRTARAGRSGVAVSFVTPEAQAHFRLIEKRQGLSLPREQIAGFEPKAGAQAEPMPEPTAEATTGSTTEPTTATKAAPKRKLPPGTGGIKGKRPSKKDKLRAAGLPPPKPG